MIGGILIAVLGAAVLGGGSQMVDWVTDWFAPDPPAGTYGTWTFDHFVGDPPSLDGMALQVETLILRDDGTYAVSQQVGSVPMTVSGTYEMRDADTMSLQQDGGTQTLTLEITVAGDELRMVDPAQGVTYVFQRA